MLIWHFGIKNGNMYFLWINFVETQLCFPFNTQLYTYQLGTHCSYLSVEDILIVSAHGFIFIRKCCCC